MRQVAGAVAALLFAVSGARADATAEDVAYKALSDMLTVAPKDPKVQGCVVSIAMDFAKFTDEVAVFRDAFLNKEFGVDFYNQRRRQVFAYIVVKRAAELVTEGFYHGHSQPECRFSIAVDYPDKFGQQQHLKAASWRFDDAQAAKINWEKFDPRDFADVALDYHLDPAVSDWVSEEPAMDNSPKSARRPAQACDPVMFDANAMFIRATSFCRKDYMDSPEGLAALDGAKKCAFDGKAMEQKAKAAMLTLDQIARAKGRAAVCPFVDQVARSVRARMN